MKEVEIKIEIDNIDQVLGQLEEQGCMFGKPIAQDDMVYLPKDVPREEWSSPAKSEVNVLRIRRQDEKCLFTLKRNSRDNFLAKIEKELEISSPETMEDIIDLLGYQLVSRVKKQRRKCNVGEYELCIDRVEDLGNYLEIEKMTAEDSEVVQQVMMEKLVEWGIDISKRVMYGYDIIQLKKKQLANS